MNPLWTILFMIAPLPILILVGRVRLRLRRRRATGESAPKKPFDPPAQPEPNALLRRFTSIDRAYLREQVPTARVGLYIVSWMVFAIMSAALVPDNVNRYRVAQTHSMAVWFSFLRASILLAPFGMVIAAITALTASTSLIGKMAQTTFYRTRPLTYRMLFWGRVVPAISIMLLGYISGLGASLVVLLGIYGPVWRHLDVNGLPMLLKLWRAHELAWLLRSPLPMFLSIATTMVLVFSVALLLLLQPLQIRAMPKPLSFVLGVFVFMTFSALGSSHMFPTLSRLGLTPTGSNVPPPLPVYLVPLALSALLLWTAQVAGSRKEN